MEPISMPLRDKCTPGCEHLHKGDSLGCESAIHCVCRCTRLRICPNHPTTPLPPTPQKVAERGPWDDAVSFNAKPLKACRQTHLARRASPRLRRRLRCRGGSRRDSKVRWCDQCIDRREAGRCGESVTSSLPFFYQPNDLVGLPAIPAVRGSYIKLTIK